MTTSSLVLPLGPPRLGAGADADAQPRWVQTAKGAIPIALVLGAQLAFFPMPVGVWVQSAILGLLGALMAVGLGLVHRLDRVVNFAQGDLGSAPAVLAYGLIGLSGVDYVVGFATGLVATVALALIVQVIVIRRFNNAPRLVLTVATIGLSQSLIVVSLLIPMLWGTTPITSAVVHVPWQVSINLSPIILNGDDLVALIVAPLALAAVAFWSLRAEVGIATRATGDRRDRAAMLGIPVNRIQTVTWVIAAVLSFLSVFLRAAILGLPLDPTFSLQALVIALAALALGGFSDLIVVAGAAVALGILEQGVSFSQPGQPTLPVTVVAGVVLVGMVTQRLWSRTQIRETAKSWFLASSSADMPLALRRLPTVQVTRAVGGAALLAVMVTLPSWMGPGEMLEMSTLIALAVVGCSVVVLTGWAGQVSLGQMSFAAVGAVAGAVALADWHWDLSLALLLAGAAGAVVAALVGLPTLKLDGVFVAVTTLAFGLAVSGYLLDRAEFSWIPPNQLANPDLFGVQLATQPSIYFTCLGVGLLMVAGLHGLRHSRFGRVLRGFSSNEPAARSYGINVTAAKISGFAVAGFVAGIAGCLLLIVNQQYVETPFDVTQSIAVFTATAVGGLSSVTGAIVGAALVEGCTVFLPTQWQLLPGAVGVLLVLLLFPQGVAGLLFTGRDKLLGMLARRHHLEVEP